MILIQFNSSSLCSACHDTDRCQAAHVKFLYYIMSMLLVVTMAEMYSKNHAVSYKSHIINCNDYM